MSNEQKTKFKVGDRVKTKHGACGTVGRVDDEGDPHINFGGHPGLAPYFAKDVCLWPAEPPAPWHAQFPLGSEVEWDDHDKVSHGTVIESLSAKQVRVSQPKIYTFHLSEELATRVNLRLRATEPKDWREAFPVGAKVTCQDWSAGTYKIMEHSEDSRIRIENWGPLFSQESFHRLGMRIVEDPPEKPADPPKPPTPPPTPPQMPYKCVHCEDTLRIIDARNEPWPCPFCAFPKAVSRLEQGPPDWAMIAKLATRVEDPHVVRGDGSVELRRGRVGNCTPEDNHGAIDRLVAAGNLTAVEAIAAKEFYVQGVGSVIMNGHGSTAKDNEVRKVRVADGSWTDEDRKGMTPPF